MLTIDYTKRAKPRKPLRCCGLCRADAHSVHASYRTEPPIVTVTDGSTGKQTVSPLKTAENHDPAFVSENGQPICLPRLQCGYDNR
jgi:hypothetical protein